MKKIIYSAVLIAVMIMASCKKDYLDINENPNQPTASSALLVLPSALNVTGGRFEHNEIGSLWAGQWSIVTSVTGFFEQKTYNVPSTIGFTRNLWSSCYDNLLDYDYVEKDANVKGLKMVEGIAQVMKVFNYQLLVDAYGNVPYKESLKGLNGLNNPVYDKAEDIYADLIPKLDIALKNLAVPFLGENEKPTVEDIIFQGDRIKWIRFANTLKLRILMRQSESGKGAEITAGIAKIVDPTAAGELGGRLFVGAYEDVAVNPGYLKTSGKQNPFWTRYGLNEAGVIGTNASFFAISEYARNLIEGETPLTLGSTGGFPTGATKPVRDMQRITRIATPAVLKATAPTAKHEYVFVGVPLGTLDNAFGYPNVSHIGPGILNKFNQPSIIMTASESLMLQAEAIAKGYMVGNYKTLFKDAVRSSFVLLKAGRTPLQGPRTVGTGINYTDWTTIPGDLDYSTLNAVLTAGLNATFDANVAESLAAANDYLTYNLHPDPAGFPLLATGNQGTIADIDAPTGEANILKVIMEQKWICMLGFTGFESWCDVRKYQTYDGSATTILIVQF